MTYQDQIELLKEQVDEINAAEDMESNNVKLVELQQKETCAVYMITGLDDEDDFHQCAEELRNLGMEVYEGDCSCEGKLTVTIYK